MFGEISASDLVSKPLQSTLFLRKRYSVFIKMRLPLIPPGQVDGFLVGPVTIAEAETRIGNRGKDGIAPTLV